MSKNNLPSKGTGVVGLGVYVGVSEGKGVFVGLGVYVCVIAGGVFVDSARFFL